jgi:hypothetical protein
VLIKDQAVMNHEKTVAMLAKAMSQIADTLPHVELQLMLYPTTRMREAVAELYAIILRFLVRARDWYEEGRVVHLIHSITRPVELRYLDLIEQISNSSRIIRAITASGQLAEFRDWHKNSSSAFHDIDRKIDERFKETNAMVSAIRDTVTRKLDLPNQH